MPHSATDAGSELNEIIRGGAHHAIVQFDRPVTSAIRSQMSAAGVELLGYLGDNAFFIGLPSAASVAALASVSPSIGIARIETDWKIHPLLAGGAAPDHAIVSHDAGQGDIIGAYVLAHRDVNLEMELMAAAVRHGAVIRDVLESVHGLVIELPAASVASFAAEDVVMWIEPALPRMTENNNQNRTVSQAGQVQGAPYNLTGDGVTALVYDGGIASITHPDLVGRLFARDNSGTTDHATHVSGTLGGNGVVNPLFKGMAPGVVIQSYGFESDGTGIFLYTNPGDIEADYTEAIHTFGADIANNSIGSNTEANGFPCSIQGDYGVTDAVIDGIVRGSLGGGPFRVVFSGGNERSNSRCDVEGFGDYYSTAPPATAKNHITVGALNSNDESVTSFTSWGPTDDGRIKPDLSGPGCQSGGDNGVTSCSTSGGYWVSCGTSMAAPTITGCLALLLQDFRVQFPGQPDPRNSTLKILLVQTAHDVQNPGPDYQTGYGGIRIKDAIDLMRNGTFFEDSLSVGELREYGVVVLPGTGEVKATLAWDDFPATPNAAVALVNDLDLVAIDPNGVSNSPWSLEPSDPLEPAVPDQNHRDNIEQVLVTSPVPGTWRIRVTGFNIPEGPQPFSLCVGADSLVAPPPAMYVHDHSLLEGNSGPTTANLYVTLNHGYPDVVSADYTIVDGSATGGEDYIVATGTVDFEPGQVVQTIPVTVNGDVDLEGDETFSVVLSNPVDATLERDQAQGTILDDDIAAMLCRDFQVVDGDVFATVESAGRVYIGGSFSRVGTGTGGGSPLDPTTGLSQANLKITGRVFAIAADGSGGWYIGGDFTHAGGVRRPNLAHIRADHTLSNWNPMANGTVYALAVNGSTVYAGGAFTTIDGQTRNYIAALDGTTGLPDAWDPSANDMVLALAVDGNRVFAGGEFTMIDGQSRNRIAALGRVSGSALAWNADANGDVLALAVKDGRIYAGGFFTQIRGVPRNHIAALDAQSGVVDPNWNPNASTYVGVLAVNNSNVYAGGFFTAIGGQPRNYVAALDAGSGLATPWDPNAEHTVTALAVNGGTVYIGGSFDSVGGAPRNGLAAVDAGSGSATSWDPDPNSTVFAIGASASTVFVGGAFVMVGGEARNNLAAFDAATGIPVAWDPNANGPVLALAVSGGTVFAGGMFTNVGGLARNRVAALDAATGSATPCNPNANGFVRALAVSGGTVYAGGDFTAMGGQPRNRIAVLDAVTGDSPPWGSGANAPVMALAVEGSTVYAGGAFTSIGGAVRNRIAALNAGSGIPTSWNPNANGIVNAVVRSGNTVYAGGSFTVIGGQTRRGIAALNASGSGAATPWDPNGAGTVNALAVRDSTVFAGGEFTIDGQSYFAALDVGTAAADPWLPNPNDAVNALAVSAGPNIYLGGSFTDVAGLPQAGIACIGTGGVVDVALAIPEAKIALNLHPNPTNGSVRLTYGLPRAAHVRIKMYDVLGRLVAHPVDKLEPAGEHSSIWVPSGPQGRLPAGIYFLQLEAGAYSGIRRLVLLN